MESFDVLSSLAVPFDESNLDTDQICPARLIKTLTVPDNPVAFFHDRRFDQNGAPRPDFILNDGAFAGAQIIVAARNFGVGSSRQAAVFALQAAGFRAVIAESFGDIFFNNALKAGVLAIRLGATEAADLRAAIHAHRGRKTRIDLPAQTITGPDGADYAFAVGALRKKCLLEGLDDLALTDRYAAEIDQFERRYWVERPWIIH